MKGAFRFPLYQGGSPDPSVYCPANGYEIPPDPAVFCPAKGYVLDEPGSGSWELIMEFSTHSPGTTTFDPLFSSTSPNSDFAWKIGDDIYYQKSLSVVLDGSTQKVQLWGKAGVSITQVTFDNDHISGVLNFSHAAFNTCPDYRVYNNSGLTSIIFPKNPTVALQQVQAYSCGLVETLDLSSYTSLNNLNFQVHSNSGLKRIIWNTAVAVTGTISQYWITDTAIFGIHDLTMFSSFGSVCQLRLYSAALENVNFAATISDAPLYIYLNDSDYEGTLDLTMFKAFRAGQLITIQGSNFTAINFHSGATGAFSNLTLTSSDVGYVDLTVLPQLTDRNSCQVNLVSMGLSQSEVDQYLADLDSISSSGYTGRSVRLTSNTAPSSAGLASKASLESKGFTVMVDS